jgi:hypothetical protein
VIKFGTARGSECGHTAEMPAYFRSTVEEFLATASDSVLARLTQGYVRDGFASMQAEAHTAFEVSISRIRESLLQAVAQCDSLKLAGILLEFPIYRLRKRIDLVLLVGDVVVPVEIKTRAEEVASADRAQAEEYGLDLRDFHEGSHERAICPVLWAFGLHEPSSIQVSRAIGVVPLSIVGKSGLAETLIRVASIASGPQIDVKQWDEAVYRPVPTIIEAATAIMSGTKVEAITRSDAENMDACAGCVAAIVEEAKRDQCHALVLVTGVPGSGKTLAGLRIVQKDGLPEGVNAVYLSGNSPLVIVLRKALSNDEYERNSLDQKVTRAEIERRVKSTIQHVNDFLRDGKSRAVLDERVIVFDEAQRAWDAEQAPEGFGRDASEPELVLELVSRAAPWSVCVCLLGTGQEINSGEEGIVGWIRALNKLREPEQKRWRLYGDRVTVDRECQLGQSLPVSLTSIVKFCDEPNLQLRVSMRQYRSPKTSEWVAAVLEGGADAAVGVAAQITKYPLLVTRSIDAARAWLRSQRRGFRRFGLVGSSGARRLRAYGLGSALSAQSGDEIAHWYLRADGDVRASYALEVVANEYTTQGLELDLVCVCWGGDFVRGETEWEYREFRGHRWNNVRKVESRRQILNSYRVLLSRAREGMLIWVPEGSDEDSTRPRDQMDRTYNYLVDCGAKPLEEGASI